MRSLYLELKPHANAGEGITHMDVGIYPYLNAEEEKYWISARLKDGTAVRLWGPIRDGFVAGITARRMQNQAGEPGAVEAKERKGYQIFPILEKAHLLSVLTNRLSDIPVFKNMARDRVPSWTCSWMQPETRSLERRTRLRPSRSPPSGNRKGRSCSVRNSETGNPGSGVYSNSRSCL